MRKRVQNLLVGDEIKFETPLHVALYKINREEKANLPLVEISFQQPLATVVAVTLIRSHPRYIIVDAICYDLDAVIGSENASCPDN